MKIIRAEAMGMCFGVRDAIALARKVERPDKVTIYGELVHNELVQRDLAARGFHQVGENDRDHLPPTEQVLVTAHGISERERARLMAAGKRLIDTTCPLVRRVHEAAQRLQREGYFVVVLGKRRHVEVAGIVGDLDRFTVVESPEDVAAWPVEKIGIVAQSTTPPALADDLIALIRAKNAGREVRYERTICQPTRNRQAAMERLLEQVEAVVVVGGRHSNNTRALVKLAEDAGIPALHVQGPEDVDVEWLSRFETVGLTAGTSTPDEVIEDIEIQLLKIGEILLYRSKITAL